MNDDDHHVPVARAVDPYVSAAGVHAAVEIAVAEQLRAFADRGPEEIRAWAAANGTDAGDAGRRPPVSERASESVS